MRPDVLTVSIIHSSLIFHLTIFLPLSVAQTCTVTTKTIKSLNIEAGLCKTDKQSDEQSTADVLIHSVNDPNTKDVDERTKCNFQCQEGYFDKDKGDKQILFECVPNPDRTDPLGQKKPAPTGCKGARVICVLAFSITLYSGPVGASVYYHQSLLTCVTLNLILTHCHIWCVLQRKRVK